MAPSDARLSTQGHIASRLNLKGNRMILPDFGANYTGFSAFQTIGGQIMAGLAYVF